jgi:hypothetical protein
MKNSEKLRKMETDKIESLISRLPAEIQIVFSGLLSGRSVEVVWLSVIFFYSLDTRGARKEKTLITGACGNEARMG